MAVISLTPILMNGATLLIGANNYEKVVNSAKLVPNNPVAMYKGIDGTITAAAGLPSWTLELNYAQDWNTTASLSRYLVAQAGTLKTIVLTPNTGGSAATVSVLIVPGDLGGAADSTSTAIVTLQVIGQPGITPTT